jgi:MFS family permease
LGDDEDLVIDRYSGAGPDIVALPVALVSTPAGAIADMFDRRIVGLVALSIALAGSISLSALAWLAVMTPDLLLASCFTIGSGMALFGPAWQASVSEQVRAEALPSAVALNGISYKLPAALGPRSAASLSRQRGSSPHSSRTRFSICQS